MEMFFPSPVVAALGAIYSMAQFENFRWVRSNHLGLTSPRSELVRMTVALTALVAAIFVTAFLISFAFERGWMALVGILMLMFAVQLFNARFARDSLGVWAIATLALWPLMVAMAFQTTWFGWLR